MHKVEQEREPNSPSSRKVLSPPLSPFHSKKKSVFSGLFGTHNTTTESFVNQNETDEPTLLRKITSLSPSSHNRKKSLISWFDNKDKCNDSSDTDESVRRSRRTSAGSNYDINYDINYDVDSADNYDVYESEEAYSNYDLPYPSKPKSKVSLVMPSDHSSMNDIKLNNITPKIRPNRINELSLKARPRAGTSVLTVVENSPTDDVQLSEHANKYGNDKKIHHNTNRLKRTASRIDKNSSKRESIHIQTGFSGLTGISSLPTKLRSRGFSGTDISETFSNLKDLQDLKSFSAKHIDSVLPVWNPCFWNQKFMETLALTDEAERRDRFLFWGDKFIAMAEKHAQTIIMELHLDNKAKTIPSADMGGAAGGVKYIVDGIFFKFCQDHELTSGRYLYGGMSPSVERASKAAGNELKGANEYFQHLYNDTSVNASVPIQLLIDCWGHRIVAMPVLPINDAKLVYGSNDGGKTVMNCDPAFNLVMERTAQKLHLAEHTVGKSNISLHSAGDVEAHRTSDGSYFLLDLSRALPPEAPSRANPRSIFYQVFRPEFLEILRSQKITKPLSSDAFSIWGGRPPKCREYNQEVVNASRYLRNTIVDQV